MSTEPSPKTELETVPSSYTAELDRIVVRAGWLLQLGSRASLRDLKPVN